MGEDRAVDEKDIAEARERLARLVGACRSGELAASPTELAALVGALAALDAMLVQ
jgi:hypothetical protein